MDFKKSLPRTIEIALDNYKSIEPEIKTLFIDVDEHFAAIAINSTTEEKLKKTEILVLAAPDLLKTLIGLHRAVSSGNPHELSEWNLNAKQLTNEILNP